MQPPPGISKALLRRVRKHMAASNPESTVVAVDDESDSETIASRLRQLTGTSHASIRDLLTKPTVTDEHVQCYLTRQKVGNALTYQLHMPLSDTYDLHCFSAKVVSGRSIGHPTDGRCYVISFNEMLAAAEDDDYAGDGPICTVRSDRPAMQYTALDTSTPQKELLHASFVTACREASNDNLPQVNLALPLVDALGNVPKEPRVPPNAKEGLGTLKALLTAAPTGEEAAKKGVVVFRAREPEWNEEAQMPVLDFQGRALLASSKNMQLTPRDDNPEQLEYHYLMGKVDDARSNVDFCGPWSCLQALAFALVEFDNASAPMK